MKEQLKSKFLLIAVILLACVVLSAGVAYIVADRTESNQNNSGLPKNGNCGINPHAPPCNLP